MQAQLEEARQQQQQQKRECSTLEEKLDEAERAVSELKRDYIISFLISHLDLLSLLSPSMRH